ncbi:MAG: CpaF/VirB11 family protein, partial [Lachnospiraceae bacterium]|nr:CpaF/VirB11 family protein [Lachnospiraceae bacterium]
MKNNILIEESKDFFGILYSYVNDDEITDIDYNGSKLWLTYSNNYRECAKLDITDDFTEQFCARVSNAVSKPFNKQYPVLEAETEFLRITIVHESVAVSGRCFCIRKSLPSVRLTEETMISTGFCTKEQMEFLKNCIKGKKNIVFCGEPGAGKTECAKFFSQYIESDEKAITIEDNAEWHYSLINEGKDCIELKVNDIVDYSLAIKTCLRLNPKWIMLSEVRSKEVVHLLECFSTGVKGITTIHTDNVRKIPDRMLNMAGPNVGSNMENDIYSFIDVGVLVKRQDVKKNGKHYAKRFIEQ